MGRTTKMTIPIFFHDFIPRYTGVVNRGKWPKFCGHSMVLSTIYLGPVKIEPLDEVVTEDSSASFQTSEDFEIHPPAKKRIVSIQPVQLAILQPQIQQPVSIQHVQQQQLAILQPQNQQPVSQQPVQHQQFSSL